jgi:hypothetical protein
VVRLRVRAIRICPSGFRLDFAGVDDGPSEPLDEVPAEHLALEVAWVDALPQ